MGLQWLSRVTENQGLIPEREPERRLCEWPCRPVREGKSFDPRGSSPWMGLATVGSPTSLALDVRQRLHDQIAGNTYLTLGVMNPTVPRRPVRECSSDRATCSRWGNAHWMVITCWDWVNPQPSYSLSRRFNEQTVVGEAKQLCLRGALCPTERLSIVNGG